MEHPKRYSRCGLNYAIGALSGATLLGTITFTTKCVRDNVALKAAIVDPSRDSKNAGLICTTGPDKVQKITGSWCIVDVQEEIDIIRQSCLQVCPKAPDAATCIRTSEERLKPVMEKSENCKKLWLKGGNAGFK